MKKILKIIRNYIGKHLLNLLIKLKRFNCLYSFTKYFPKSKYKAIQSLMHRGYLDLAYEIAKDYTPKEHEKLLIERVLFMHKVKKNGYKSLPYSFHIQNNLKPLFIVHNSLPYEHAGYAIRTHTIVTHLKKQNIEVDVVTRAGYPWDLIKHRDKDYKKIDIIDGIKYIRLNDKKKTFKKGTDRTYIKVYADAIEKEIQKNHYTILQAHSNYLNGLAMLEVAAKLKLPALYEIRGLWHITRTTLDPHFKYAGMYEYEQEMELSIARKVHRVIVISKALQNLLISFGINKEKIRVIPNAVDLKKFHPIKKNNTLVKQYNLENKFVIGFLGSLTAYEGLKELILSVDNLVEIENYANIVLMIVGDGRERKNLEKLTQSKNIIFTGRVAFQEVNNYYSLFDICPFPRNNVEVCRYVPPLKPLEAMAMQKAIIVSDVAPLLEMVEDNQTALVCKADSIEDLKAKILILYKDKQKCNQLAINARKFVEQHRNWSNISKQYKEIYNEFQ